MKFVDPCNDVAFKKIFGSENKKGVLISFLNGILDLAGTPKEIVDVSLLNPFQVPRLEGLKLTILDIRAVDRTGITYIVEMQVLHTTAFEKRVLYYATRAYSDQLERAMDYPKLNQVIFIGLLDFVLFPKEHRYQTRHLILEEKSGEQYLKDIEFNFIELPKFVKGLEDLADVKEKWLYFVKHAEELEAVPEQLMEPAELLDAFETANTMSWSREEMTFYDARDIYIQDERWRYLFAREEGEKNAAMKIAKAMRAIGMTMDQIQELTGVPSREIET